MKKGSHKNKSNREGNCVLISSAAIIILIFIVLEFINLVSNFSHPFVYNVIDDSASFAASQAAAEAAKNKITKSNTSIAFYIIAGASQSKLDPDLRGIFWEHQLKDFDFNYTLQYLSDGPLRVNGIDFMVLPANGPRTFQDAQFCIRTPETWRHFYQYNLDKKWYYRGIHDTYVNLPELLKFIDELEKKGDPMTTYNFAFNMHEYGLQYYPQGGTGYLFSNYAMRKFYENIELFTQLCRGSFDDVALTYFFKKMGLDVMDYQTNKFIVTWPNTENDVILKKQYSKVPKCPPYYQLYPNAPKLIPAPAHTVASVHMHRVPMDLPPRLIEEAPDDFAVFFPDANTPRFCRMTK
ncbi:hypothetical protein TRFO_13500 [Tritrichomonas foetus]|uniref:Uncharacterized protein n=1 Tax=Tritrichomonas foetus TaxID=1144522 RepID=A0A1J4KXN8_9EUKA|nr:hypothetical protein TRFO_13500 [Tritrichomonas foetus]|eukprot:OHT16017.1 hypothetical protein TRFO_13500 [Tritrichomonas foetus]